MELPPHPDTNDSETQPPPGGPSRAVRVTAALLVGLVAVIVLLHLTGVLSPPTH